jgi:hypothetical protein
MIQWLAEVDKSFEKRVVLIGLKAVKVVLQSLSVATHWWEKQMDRRTLKSRVM